MGYMDGRMDLAGHRRVEAHLSHCAACRESLDALRAAAAALPGWLSALDAAPSDERRALAMAAVERARFRRSASRGSRRGMLAAAAMVALMLTVAFGTPPGRAWVGEAADRLGIAFGARAVEEPVEPEPPVREALATTESAAAAGPAPTPPQTAGAPGAGRAGPPPGTSEAVHFSPTGNYVLVRFESRQRAGAAAIWVRDADQGAGQVVAGRRGETLVPVADGVRIRNQASSRADYTIVVPTRYSFVRIQIGDEPETVISISRSRQDWLWTVSLADSEAR